MLSFDQIKINRERLLTLTVVLTVWTLFGLFFGAQSYIEDIYLGKLAYLSGYLVSWLLCGYSWAILTYPVVLFARRFSFERSKWLRFLLIHVPASLLFSVVQLWVYIAIVGVLFGYGSRGPLDYFGYLVVKEIPQSLFVYFAIVSAILVYDAFIKLEDSDQYDRFVPRSDPGNNGSPAVKEYQPRHITGAEPAAFINRISVKQNGRIVFVDLDEVKLIESYGNYLFVHTNDKKYLIRETMKSMETKLDPELFVRVRHSTIVPIDEIKEMRTEPNGELGLVLKNEKALSSTRRYRKNLARLLKP